MQFLDILLNSGIEDWKLFNLHIVDFNDFGKLAFRLLFNSAVLYVLIQVIYGRSGGRKEFTFTYFALGTAIFLLCFLLEGVKIELGFALGLFAVFGILKYRTDAIPIREMTYLFVVIGVAVVNALANKKVSLAELTLTNAAIVVCVYLLEKYLIRSEGHIDMVYEKIENVKADRKPIMIAELEERTGLRIKRVDFIKIDFLKDIAQIRVYYDKNVNPEAVAKAEEQAAAQATTEEDK